MSEESEALSETVWGCQRCLVSAGRASERTHLDRAERVGGRPLLALPLGLRGTKARDPRALEPLSTVTTDPAL